MPESSRFRTALESQCVHGFQSLLKSARQNLHPNLQLSQDILN